MTGKQRIGILTGGGDCPGLNAAIRAAAKTALRRGYEVAGIRDGWQGLIENRSDRLDGINTSGIIDRGGTILGTSRVSPFYVEDGVKRVFAGVKELGLRGLVVLGGEGTLSATHRLAEMGLPVVGIPKTIDNDVRETDYPIGFQTAVQIATEALDRLRSTAESHSRVMLLEVMGRRAGWIATYAGLANGADAILIPEVPLDGGRLDELCQMLRRRTERGKRFSIVVVAEGTEIRGGAARKADACSSPARNPMASGGIANVIGEIIEKDTGLETRVTSLGYVQRGGTPVAYDRSLATVFGVKAVELIEAGKFGEMTALKGNRILGVPLGKVANAIKTVSPHIYETAAIFFG